MSLKAQLSADAVRNLLRGKVRSAPRLRTSEGLARALDVSLVDLVGAEAAAPLRAVPSPALRRAGPLMVEIPEYLLRPGSSLEIEDRTRPPTVIWSVPAAILEGRQAPDVSDHLAVVRAPAALPLEGIQIGDRLLVDRSPSARLPSPSGLFITHDEVAHGLARAALNPGSRRLRVTSAAGTDEVDAATVVLVGRVLARWAWL